MSYVGHNKWHSCSCLIPWNITSWIMSAQYIIFHNSVGSSSVSNMTTLGQHHYCVIVARDSFSLNFFNPGGFEQNIKNVIVKLILATDDWGISCKIVLKCLSLALADEKSTLVQVMTWRCQATSHHVNQCWPWSVVLYNVTKRQWFTT